jgi:hypothetical protein
MSLARCVVIFFCALLPINIGAQSPGAGVQRTPMATPADASTPPIRVESPDGKFSVEIQTNSKADDLDNLLVIRNGEKEIARKQTFGYLLNVFWTDTGKYVAINNRRANAGDYLWIFSLSNGECIKAADSDSDILHSRAMAAFQRIDKRAVPDKLQKEWIQGKGWWGSDNKLLVRVSARYDYIVGEFPAHFVYDAQVKVAGLKIEFVSGEARAVSYLTD